MRIVTLIIMVLAFLVGAGLSSMLKVNIDRRLSKVNFDELAELQKLADQYKESGVDLSEIEEPSVRESLEQLENIPSKSRATTAGILGILLSLVALAMVVLAFMKKRTIEIAGIAVIGLSFIMWLVTPTIEASRFSGANPKNIALISLIALAVAAGSAIMSFKIHLKKSIAEQS